MTQSNHQLVRDFFKAIAQGEVPEGMVTPDLLFWSVNSGDTDKARFTIGIQLLARIFNRSMVYHIESLTAEDDRVVADVRSTGTLPDGEPFKNTHVFLFRIRDGRICYVAEYMNQFVVRDKIAPRLQALMANMKK